MTCQLMITLDPFIFVLCALMFTWMWVTVSLISCSNANRIFVYVTVGTASQNEIRSKQSWRNIHITLSEKQLTIKMFTMKIKLVHPTSIKESNSVWQTNYNLKICTCMELANCNQMANLQGQGLWLWRQGYGHWPRPKILALKAKAKGSRHWLDLCKWLASISFSAATQISHFHYRRMQPRFVRVFWHYNRLRLKNLITIQSYLANIFVHKNTTLHTV